MRLDKNNIKEGQEFRECENCMDAFNDECEDGRWVYEGEAGDYANWLCNYCVDGGCE